MGMISNIRIHHNSWFKICTEPLEEECDRAVNGTINTEG